MKAWSELFQSLKENNFQPTLIYSAKLSCKVDEEIRYIHGKENLKKFMPIKPALPQILKDILERGNGAKNVKKFNRLNLSGRVTS